nr:2Fe-2S iron-sulfur cluster-binding protein [Rubritepida sp.]
LLREAFTRHHALQCGYCTPGMMMTARDIVTRLGAVDEARIREELAGNLCRCTGYRGIVRAIAEVAATRPTAAPTPRRAAPVLAATAPPASVTAQPVRQGPLPNRLTHEEVLRLSPDEAWAVLSDPARLVACLPGARLTERDGESLAGEIALGLGPFTARFLGRGHFTLDAAQRMGSLTGRGQDGASATEGEVRFRLVPVPDGARLQLDLGWRLTGPLAQFARPALLRGLVGTLAAETARRIEAEARGTPPPPSRKGWLRRWWLRLFGRA